MTYTVQGQSYQESNPTNTPTPSLPGYEVSDFAFVAHSHGFVDDEDTAIANRAPSSGDWAFLDALAGSHDNIDNFMMYIIDQTGVMRAYNYQTPEQRGVEENSSETDWRGDVTAEDSVNNNSVRECNE